MKLDGNVKTTATELVRAQAEWRRTIGNDMAAALDDTPQHRRFTTALTAFKDAFFAANPDMAVPVHERNGVHRESLAPTAQTVMLRSEGVLASRSGKPTELGLGTLQARSVHDFLKSIAVEEFGPGAGATAPRPFNDQETVRSPYG